MSYNRRTIFAGKLCDINKTQIEKCYAYICIDVQNLNTRGNSICPIEMFNYFNIRREIWENQVNVICVENINN